MKRRISACYDAVTSRFSRAYCPFSHVDYEGIPERERNYFCLLWNLIIAKHPIHYDLGYLQNLQIIGRRRCSKEEYSSCPLAKLFK